MRNFYFTAKILLLSLAFFSVQANAQAPQKMSYQSVIRNSSNVLLANTQVGIRISVLQGNASGTAVYVETQTATTNANGLLSIQIGTGTATSGTFAGINWAAGPYFIKTETDPSGGTNYTITGTQEILSVPYALHAKTADSLTGVTTLTVGQSYQGGKIFWLDATRQHGLIAAISDQSTGIRWRGGTNTYTMAKANGIAAGKSNTDIIISNQGFGDGSTYAARICREYNGGNYGDWYLPSIYELNLMYENIGPGNVLGLGNVGGFAYNYYWSSTEYDNYNAWGQAFYDGSWNDLLKGFTGGYVRAVRSF